ncbi:MAG: outer membrane beta-barrel protein [Saprospiraceae bacterium]
MKKVLILLIACFIVNVASSQNYLSGVHLGLNGTLNSSSVYYQPTFGSSDFYGHDGTLAFSAGANVSLSVNDVHEFQLEFLYSSQGQNMSDVSGSGADKVALEKKIRLNYLQVPLVYKYKMWFDPYSASSPMHYFVGGLYTAQLNSASVSFTSGGSSATFLEGAGAANPNPIYEPEDMKDLFLAYDFGLVLGYGLEYPLAGDLSFTAEVRGNIGLVDVNSLGWRFPVEEYGYKSSTNATLGLRLGLVYNLFL